MKRTAVLSNTRLVLALIFGLGAFATAQSAPQPPTETPVPAAAYVYIAGSNGSQTQIEAYSASANGALTAVPGSPFKSDSISTLAASGQWLYGANTVDIFVYAIASTGAIKPVSSINAQQYNGYADGGPISLFLDRTSSTLYDLDIYGNNGANNTYQFFSSANPSGGLTYLGATASASPEFETSLSFIPGDKFGYGASNYHGFQNIYGFSRAANGALTDMNLNTPIPAAPVGAYGPYLAAADTTNHLAITLSPTNDMTPCGPTQLASYTANSEGTLTTTNTSQNMPVLGVGSPNSIAISSSGTLLAVGGTSGLQVFHFNGANPITKFTGPLVSDNISQVAWDSTGHLYAISQSTGKLYAFTVTSTTARPAPGSPHTVAGPMNLVVLSK
ncbi:MAG TPA: hypothetical protein VND65_00945 [Candidatus Binatia bacterium]|nr:hypothetical protein [Candidatus Binatia bacterium]